MPCYQRSLIGLVSGTVAQDTGLKPCRTVGAECDARGGSVEAIFPLCDLGLVRGLS